MTVLMEGDLQISIENALNARKFDGADHGLSHCMKAVDFVVELSDRYLFIEFKDPQHPKSEPENREQFMQDFNSGLLDEQLKYKYRDSFLYEWASGRADKPVHYYVLIAIEDMDDVAFQHKTDDLGSKLPLKEAASWNRPIVAACQVFNLRLWNRYLPNFPVARRSARP